MLNLSFLKTFLSVAESSSFTRAASERYRSQSAISMQMRRLEEVVGVELFERNGKKVALTREGEIFLQYSRRIIRLVEEAISAVHRKELPGRTVRFGCIEDYAGRVIPKVVAEFLGKNPAVQIEVRIGETPELMKGLGRDYDLVMVGRPVGSQGGGVILRDRLVWARSKTVPLERESPLPIALRSGATMDHRWATAALDASSLTWRCTYMPSGIGTLQSAVEAGLAIGVFKLLTLPGDLCILDGSDGFPDLPDVEICLLTAPDAEHHPGVSELASALTVALRAMAAARPSRRAKLAEASSL